MGYFRRGALVIEPIVGRGIKIGWSCARPSFAAALLVARKMVKTRGFRPRYGAPLSLAAGTVLDSDTLPRYWSIRE